jgi:hypothetical protein
MGVRRQAIVQFQRSELRNVVENRLEQHGYGAWGQIEQLERQINRQSSANWKFK